jgi:hypothetical protein
MILSWQQALAYLGKAGAATDAEIALVQALLPSVEQQIKDYCHCDLEQATYTEYYPTMTRKAHIDQIGGTWDVSGSRAYRVFVGGDDSATRLYLRQIPVRSITSIYEDSSAYYGEGSGDFGASTELTLGTDYSVAWESGSNSSNGLCRTGRLVKHVGNWSMREGTIKVTYTGGWTADELLTGKGSPIGLAVREQLQYAFSRKGTDQGPVYMERLADRTVQYAGTQTVQMQLTETVKRRLNKFRNWAFAG